jgi:flagellar protein FliT
MLTSARCGDWDEVARLEATCSGLIDQLQLAAHKSALAAEHLKAQSAIMRRILANDAQIRHLAESWFDDLDALMGGHPRSLH